MVPRRRLVVFPRHVGLVMDSKSPNHRPLRELQGKAALLEMLPEGRGMPLIRKGPLPPKGEREVC